MLHAHQPHHTQPPAPHARDSPTPLYKETKALETAVLRAFHEAEGARDFEDNIKARFRRFHERVAPLVQEAPPSRDLLERVSKL